MESVNKCGCPPGAGIGCAAGHGQSKDGLLRLIRLLGDIRGEMLRFMSDCRGAALGDIDPAYARSAENLLHYLALRRHDLRQLQSELAGLGLSSLGRSESHVMATVEAVLETLCRLAGWPAALPKSPKMRPRSILNRRNGSSKSIPRGSSAPRPKGVTFI